MKINGKFYGFKLTTGAAIELAKMCKDKDLMNLGQVIDKTSTEETMNAQYEIAKVLNEGFCEFEESMGRKANKLPDRYPTSMTFAAFIRLKNEAFEAYINGINESEIEAETEEEKKPKTGVEG